MVPWQGLPVSPLYSTIQLHFQLQLLQLTSAVGRLSVENFPSSVEFVEILLDQIVAQL